MVREQLAARLKFFREKVGMTIYEVGEKIGKSGKMVSAWENGRGQPDADMLLTLCDIYKIESIAALYGKADSALSQLSSDELYIIKVFRTFNAEGHEKVLSYIYDLESTGRYKKPIRLEWWREKHKNKTL